MRKSKKNPKISPATVNFHEGLEIINSNPIFTNLRDAADVWRDKSHIYRKDSLTLVTNAGDIFCNPEILATPQEWARAIAHSLLHLAFGHFQKKENPSDWNIACDFVIENFLSDMGFCKTVQNTPTVPVSDEEKMYNTLANTADKSQYIAFSGQPDMLFGYKRQNTWKYPNGINWSEIFARSLAFALTKAVNAAAGEDSEDYENFKNTPAHRAARWFISNYPLLGAVAARFKIVYDQEICNRMDIRTAAVSPNMSEIYINPVAQLSAAELQFVLAHEYLHAALRHDRRQEWRNGFLWNVACDFVINEWLTAMSVGDRPDGCLYDEQFKGESAEAVYDRIVNDMRYYRKLASFRGVGVGDILGEDVKKSRKSEMDLDDFYRRALAQGLQYHEQQGRGYLPAGLVEEIRALAYPPIPWDVQLAKWFDHYFQPLEQRRTYARPSRRQSSTPNIPRPNWKISEEDLQGRTFGVVLDTSGSMERSLLAVALGAIASYSAARDVPAARVVFCDAAAYDAGYMKPADIASGVQVKGRGGTILQPGIDLLRNAADFPQDAPILVITDAECDKVILYGREHAFLVPQAARLPFVPKGKVFRIR